MIQKNRQLSAIIFTDIVSYSEMMQHDETGTIHKIEEYRRLLETTVLNFGGQIIQFYGDGCLILMASAYHAVLCGIKIQELCVNAQIPLRIGIHLGELTVKDGMIYGDGLNIAARLEAMGWNRSILISRTLYEQIHNHPDISVTRLGEFYLKNLKFPLVVYSVSVNGNRIPKQKLISRNIRPIRRYLPSVTRRKDQSLLLILMIILLLIDIFINLYLGGKSGGLSQTSIAVVPFLNLTRDSSQQNLCEDITQDVQFRLAEIKDLQIIPGTAISEESKKKKSLWEIGEEMNISLLLSGNVRKSGNRFFVFAELIDVDRKTQVWSQTFECNKDEVPGLQNRISAGIANR
jgi:class 3 adenylate cyclase/TolB-like protein